MNLRRFMEEALIVSPVVVLLALGVQSRTAPVDFEPYTYSDVLNTRILAYVEPMRQIAELRSNRREQDVSTDDALAIAQRLNSDFKAHRLPYLQSDNALDTVREGIKNDIVTQLHRLDYYLRHAAETEPELDKKIELIEAGFELHAIYRYIDLYAVGIASARQRQWIHMAHSWISKANPGQRKRLRAVVERLASDQRKFGLVVSRSERHYMRDGVRWGEQRIGVMEALMESRLSDPSRTQIVLALESGASGDTAFKKQTMGLQYARFAQRSEDKVRERTLLDLSREASVLSSE